MSGIISDNGRSCIILPREPSLLYVEIKSDEDYIRISTKKDWADKAGVTNTAVYQSKNGWWGKPHVRWTVPLRDKEGLSEITNILARIMKVRHS